MKESGFRITLNMATRANIFSPLTKKYYEGGYGKEFELQLTYTVPHSVDLLNTQQ